MRKTKAQASMEAIAIVSVIMIMFSMVMLQVAQKNNDTRVLGEIYKKKVVCNSIANSISEVFSSGAYSQMNTTLPYKYPVTVYGKEGYIVVGDEPDSVDCSMSAGMMNYSTSFKSTVLSLLNLDGLVVINTDTVVTTTTTTTTTSASTTTSSTSSTTSTTTTSASTTTSSTSSTTSTTTTTLPSVEGLAGQWHLDENSGEIAYDSSGNKNDGKILGARWVKGVSKSALSFDGEDDYVIVPDDDSLDLTEGVTMESWVKTFDHRTAKVIEKGDWDGHGIGLDKWKGWKGGVYIDGDRRYSLCWGGGRPTLDRGYHLVITYNGSLIRFYVDAKEKENVAVEGKLRVNKRELSLGSNRGAQKFLNGIIDEAAIYSRALSEEEVKKRYVEYKP